MPRMFRVMLKDSDGHPKIQDDDGLGVRYSDDKRGVREVKIDAEGKVVINDKGMSVFRHWEDIPLTRKPERLGGASRGDQDAYCFRLGEGKWESGIILLGKLDLLAPNRPAFPNHGVVRPLIPRTLAEYRALLAETQNDWILDETPE